MHARASRGLVIVAGIVAMGGCSLLTALDGLQGPGDASFVDAPADATALPDATDADATADDGATDSGTVDGGGGLCPSPATDASVVFCDDFDDSDASLFPHWSQLVANAGATVARIDSDASTPFGVEFTMPLNDGGPQAELTRTFLSSPKTSVRYSFDVRVLKYPKNNLPFNLSPVEVAGSSAAGTTEFVSLKASGATFTEQYPLDGGGFQTVPHILTNGISLGVWVAVRIEWTLGDGGSSAQVFFDGQAVSVTIPLDPRTVFGFPLVIAGTSYEDLQSDGVVVDIDNVVFTMD